MKKTQKKILGLFGLLLVAITTVFAATLPSPGALAVTSSVTDTIVVRVVGSNPRVEITNPKNGQSFVSPDQTVSFIYEVVNNVVIKIDYTDQDGNLHTYTLDTINADYAPGSGEITIDLSGPEYGYGDYVVTITGDHNDKIVDEDSIAFGFYPVTMAVSEDEDTDDVTATLGYDDNNTDIDHIVVEVFDENGNRVTAIPDITVEPGTKEVNLPFKENKIPGGKYIIRATAYGVDGEPLYTPSDVEFTYETMDVPNTGALLNGLNISKADFLATGLIAFFLVGIFGLVYIAKSNTKNKRSSRRK